MRSSTLFAAETYYLVEFALHKPHRLQQDREFLDIRLNWGWGVRVQ